MRVLIALGGNALLPRGASADATIQVDHVAKVAPAIAAVAREHDVVVTHGNGPQVGLLAIESATDASLDRPYPLDVLVAETQGMIGYWLQREIGAALGRPVVTVVTQTIVERNDPAFRNPTKFVGASYDRATAERLAAERGWTVARDGDAWRRVVPSPAPIDVVECPTIATLLDHRVTVVCAGGGGVPVVASDDGYVGVEAVVDKDLVAAMLAVDLEMDLLVLLTDVDAVYRDFGTHDAEAIGAIGAAELAALRAPAGSMGPKIAAACRFTCTTGRTAVIGELGDLDAIMRGEAGTRVIA